MSLSTWSIFWAGWVKGINLGTTSVKGLKVMSGVVAHVIIVSAQSKELGFWVFSTWSDLRVRIWGLLGQGIGDLDLGLTIKDCLVFNCFDVFVKEIILPARFVDILTL